MQLSKEMSFLTSFSTIVFSPYMIQLNITRVLSRKTVTLLLLRLHDGKRPFDVNKNRKTSLKTMTNQTTGHTHVWFACPANVTNSLLR